MKTGAKLIMLLAVLAICMPAQGEILVYRKTIRCEGAEYGDVNDIYRETIRGFLVLDVTYEDNEISAINSAYQWEYGRYEGEKWADGEPESHEFEYQRFADDRQVLYSFAELGEDEGSDAFEALVLQGKARSTRLDPNEIPISLAGYGVFNYTEDEVGMCQFRLRLDRRATRMAAEEGYDVGDVLDEIYAWLIDRGYLEELDGII